MYGTVKKTHQFICMHYYVAPETPMMSSVIADCPYLAPPNILDKSTPVLRIERNFFENLWKKILFAAHAAPGRRRRFIWTGGASPPPTKMDRRAAADTMTSAHGSTAV